jgi:predicted Zn-dependent protease with MMP-like domain
MSNKKLIEYLNEFKAELQEMFDEFDHELSNNENDELYQDAYNMVGDKLEDAINNVDILISDIDDGKYDGFVDMDEDYKEYGGDE